MTPLLQIILIELGFFHTKVQSNAKLLEVHPAYTKSALPSVTARDQFCAPGFKFPGDAQKAMEKVYELAYFDEPPARLVLGKDALSAIKTKLEAVNAEMNKFESWSDDLLLH